MKVKFVPQNVEFEIKPGESVMHLAEDNGLYVKSVCRGVPSCAECRVRIVEGETNVFAPVAAELALIGSGWFIDRRRLSCQLQCIGDVTIDMSEQIAKQQGLIGGRKAKAAKAIGDRVEDETVIRDSSAGGGRRDRDEDEDDERPSRDSRGGGQRDGDRGRREGGGQRPQGQGPRPQGQASQQGSGGGGIQPRHEPRSPVGGSYGGQPPADADQSGENGGGNRSGNREGGSQGGGRSRRRRR